MNPKIRFKADDGTQFPDFKQNKFKNLVTLERGSSPRPINNYITKREDGVNWIKIGDVSKNSMYIESTEEKITKEGAAKSRKVSVGDIILSNSMSYGRPYILQIDGCIHDGWFVLKNYEKVFIRDYLCYLLTTPAIQSQYRRLSAGGVVENISSELVNSVLVNYPTMDEQKKIVNFLSDIDSMIFIQEQQLATLEEQKKGVMQKIFSQEVRFKDDEGNEYPEWEEKKLEEIATPKARIGWQNLRKEEFLSEGDIYLITGTDFQEGYINFNNCNYIDEERYNQDINIQVKNGDILITKDGTLGKVAIIENLNKKATLNAGVFVLNDISKKIYNYYLYHYLKTSELMKYAKRTSTGGTIQHLNQNVLVSFPIPFPCLDEQKKIADFLSDYDKVIEVKKKKIEGWKNIREGLLQQMFV